MKVALSHLEQFLLVKPNWLDIFDDLTQAGIEIEEIKPIGTPDKDGFGAIDSVVELKITPNRGDCLSVIGLVREIAALFNLKYSIAQVNDTLSNYNSKPLQLRIDEPSLCPTYTAMLIHGVDNTLKLPDFISDRLEKSGFNLVSPLVDITNYVMLELGQPLHVFDAVKTGNSLLVRLASSGEAIELINGQSVQLTSDTLLVCDANNQPAAIAGVMGGQTSAVDISTQEIILEAAYFMPNVIAAKAKQYGVVSDAAYRFERGVDFTQIKSAVIMASELLTKYLGGKVVAVSSQTHDEFLPQREPISIAYSEFSTILGITINETVVKDIFTRLGFTIVAHATTDSQISVIAPSYRFDIYIKQDLLEEVARVYGYDNIVPQLPITNYTLAPINSFYTAANLLKNSLLARGFNEIVSYAFIESNYANKFNYSGFTPVELQNSIAGFTHLRTSLFAGLIKALQYNINRGAVTVKLFELARVFYGTDSDLQPLKLSGVCYGNKNSFNWYDNGEIIDFFDVKGDIEVLLGGLTKVSWVKCDDNPVLHSGRCAKIYSHDKAIGVFGQLHPKIAQELGIDDAPYLFELDVTSLTEYLTQFKLAIPSKFQKVARDLAFVMDDKLAVSTIIDYIYSLGIEALKQVYVFDIYSGDKIPVQQKSVAFKIIFQAHKTLTDAEINSYLEQIIDKTNKNFGIKLR